MGCTGEMFAARSYRRQMAGPYRALDEIGDTLY